LQNQLRFQATEVPRAEDPSAIQNARSPEQVDMEHPAPLMSAARGEAYR
jgi:hypothetical protein